MILALQILKEGCILAASRKDLDEMVNYAVEKDSAAIANMEEEGRIVMVKGGLERGAIHEWKG
jgi:hypothetical protein